MSCCCHLLDFPFSSSFSNTINIEIKERKEGGRGKVKEGGKRTDKGRKKRREGMKNKQSKGWREERKKLCPLRIEKLFCITTVLQN